MGYDWEEYLRSYDFPEEKYQNIADAVFRKPDLGGTGSWTA